MIPPRRAAGWITVAAVAAMIAGTGAAAAQQGSDPGAPADGSLPPAAMTPPGPFRPDTDDLQPDTKPDTNTPEALPDVWIFSGELQNTHETFSGTLVAKKGDAQFELKLAGGATCDGSDVSGDIGLVRLSEITCTDDRTMRALFVPQNGQELKVFGHVGDERFAASAHLLGTDPVPEKPQTAEPTAPTLRRPPPGPGGKSP